jgi:hypothetical protein
MPGRGGRSGTACWSAGWCGLLMVGLLGEYPIASLRAERSPGTGESIAVPATCSARPPVCRGSGIIGWSLPSPRPGTPACRLHGNRRPRPTGDGIVQLGSAWALLFAHPCTTPSQRPISFWVNRETASRPSGRRRTVRSRAIEAVRLRRRGLARVVGLVGGPTRGARPTSRRTMPPGSGRSRAFGCQVRAWATHRGS